MAGTPPAAPAVRLAVIGGTGVYDPSMLVDVREERRETPYGAALVRLGRFAATGEPVAFLARHGAGHSVPPHQVNYRANLLALKDLGVERVLATAAVGSLTRDVAPGTFVLVDQFLDFTKGRPSTYYENGRGVAHVDVSDPYCPELRALLGEAAAEMDIPVRAGGTYVCTEGPRFETPAEIRMYAGFGGHVVGMTGVPEVVLARELSLCYATIAMVTNCAAGISPTPLTHSEVLAVMNANAARLRALLGRVLGGIPRERACACGRPLEVHGL